MIDRQVNAWRESFDAAMASDEESDLEPLWIEVGEAIDGNPAHADLRRLRIRMAECFHDHGTRHADLLALHGIDPSDRAVWLDLALVQHRWAFLLVPEEEAEEEEPDDDSGEDLSISIRVREPSEREAREPVAALERQAREWLSQLVRENRQDPDFCARVFAGMTEGNVYAPWLRLTLALESIATHPGDERFERELAFAWEDLANQTPENYDAEQAKPPIGFMFDVNAMLWDPFLQERALRALDRLLEHHPGDPDLLGRIGRLLEARCDFTAASEAWAQAHQAARDAAASQSDDEARDRLVALSAEYGRRADLCRGGRETLVSALFTEMSDAVATLELPFPRREGASEAAEAAADEMDRSRREQAEELNASVAQIRASMPAPAVGEETIEAMRAQARQVAASVIGSIRLAPLSVRPVTPADFEDDWAGALSAVRESFAALGWRDLGWAEWDDFRAMLGHQAVSSIWVDPLGATVAHAFQAQGMLSLDLETELTDGRCLASGLCRGRIFLTGGPEVDMLFVEPALSVPEAAALHAARVAQALAGAPGLALRPCARFDDAVAMQERSRESKNRFRLATGLTESESLGLPHDYPELFAPLLREAVNEALAAFRAATRA